MVSSYIRSLLMSDALRTSTVGAMIASLRLPESSSGLDVGCGVGLQCLQMVQAVGEAGHVTGLDNSAEMLAYGAGMVKQAGLDGRISFREGDIHRLPFADETFDWAWSCDCVGYGPWDTPALVKEMARVIKPGGMLALAAWSSEKLLPGYPGLEARLQATAAGLAPFSEGRIPELHFMRGLGWFRELGFKEPRADSFAGSVAAPLSDEIRAALADLFAMRWPDVTTELSAEDAALFNRLCRADSPDYILDNPDYTAFFTYAMFSGVK